MLVVRRSPYKNIYWSISLAKQLVTLDQIDIRMKRALVKEIEDLLRYDPNSLNNNKRSARIEAAYKVGSRKDRHWKQVNARLFVEHVYSDNGSGELYAEYM